MQRITEKSRPLTFSNLALVVVTVVVAAHDLLLYAQ
jgi:hypothetical protein